MRIQESPTAGTGQTSPQQPLLKTIRDAVSQSSNVNPDWKSRLIDQLDRSHAITNGMVSNDTKGTEN